MTLLKVLRQRLLLNNLKKTFVHQSTADEIFGSSKIQSINAIKYYSSSSSSSSSSSNTKRTNTPNSTQKQELSFVQVNYIHPRDLAQSTFYALHRPLLTIGSETLNNQLLEKQQQKMYEEEEEDFEGDFSSNYNSSSSSSSSPSSSNNNNISSNNSISTHLTSPSPIYILQNLMSLTPEESQQIANKFLNDIESRIRKQQFSDDFENIVENNSANDDKNQLKKNSKKTSKLITKKLNLINNSKYRHNSHSHCQQRKLQLLPHKLIYNKNANNNITYHMTNIVQKKRLKMNKHKHRKLKKKLRARNKKLGKL